MVEGGHHLSNRSPKPHQYFDIRKTWIWQSDVRTSSRPLTHWGRVTHICVGKLNIIGSDNGLSPGRRQAIIWTNAGILLIRPLGTNFNEILIGNQTFSFKKIHSKMSSGKWRPFCLGLNVLTHWNLAAHACQWTGSSSVQEVACYLGPVSI